ncbi:MAG: ATPase, T2SS/T4P/T4SS family [Desulfobulbaceae bacterium]|nr:ATPase, T2SS/T4P/T4SS family [Desulfobulbaceae bacterium]
MENGSIQKKTVRWHKRLGAYLLAAGLVDEETLSKALDVQRTQNPPKTRIGKLLIDMGMTDDVNIAKTLASQLNLDFIHLRNLRIPNDVLSIIPASIATSSMVIPISKKNKKLVVAMANPLEQYVIDDLRFITGLDIGIAVAPESEVVSAIDKYYTNNPNGGLSEDVDIDAFLEIIEDEKPLDDDDDIQNLIGLTEQAPVVKFTNHILANAIKLKASDIHIEPRHADTLVRYRVDGIMREILHASKKSHFSVVARVKIISNMDISIRRKPQDGRTRIKFGNKEYDLRISTIPTSYGEKVTIRILDPDGADLHIDDLCLPEKDLEVFKSQVGRPQGIILVTGPTGSGKSTTLYACLNELNSPEVNIITVEDPVEYDILGVNQVQINVKAGITFASGLRSILRQDPDIVMVGEIRDKETASIAFQASQTGHLVLTTLHTNDAPSAVIRLVDMGIEPYVISAGLNCVLGQRLVRRLCPKCRTPDPDSSNLVKRYHAFLPEEVTPIFWVSKGCDHCHSIGYKGRLGVFEVLKVSRAIQEALVSTDSMIKVRRVAESEGFKMLAYDGLQKAISGITSHRELVRNVSIQTLDDFISSFNQDPIT